MEIANKLPVNEIIKIPTTTRNRAFCPRVAGPLYLALHTAISTLDTCFLLAMKHTVNVTSAEHKCNWEKEGRNEVGSERRARTEYSFPFRYYSDRAIFFLGQLRVFNKKT